MWDGASYHKYGEFRDYLSSVNSDKKPNDWSITCILFAPNAPQQNPVEDIWLQAKNFWLFLTYYAKLTIKMPSKQASIFVIIEISQAIGRTFY
jgi:transposase